MVKGCSWRNLKGLFKDVLRFFGFIEQQQQLTQATHGEMIVGFQRQNRFKELSSFSIIVLVPFHNTEKIGPSRVFGVQDSGVAHHGFGCF